MRCLPHQQGYGVPGRGAYAPGPSAGRCAPPSPGAVLGRPSRRTGRRPSTSGTRTSGRHAEGTLRPRGFARAGGAPRLRGTRPGDGRRDFRHPPWSGDPVTLPVVAASPHGAAAQRTARPWPKPSETSRRKTGRTPRLRPSSRSSIPPSGAGTNAVRKPRSSSSRLALVGSGRTRRRSSVVCPRRLPGSNSGTKRRSGSTTSGAVRFRGHRDPGRSPGRGERTASVAQGSLRRRSSG